MTWHMLNFSVAEVAAGKHLACKAEFEQAFVQARGPREMALFQREREDGGVELLFTPECQQHAADLLERWHSSPCERPSLAGLHLLVGHTEITYYLM